MIICKLIDYNIYIKTYFKRKNKRMCERLSESESECYRGYKRELMGEGE